MRLSDRPKIWTYIYIYDLKNVHIHIFEECRLSEAFAFPYFFFMMRGVWEELKFVRLALHFICLNCKLVCSWSQGICIWPLATLPGWLKIVYHHLPSTSGPSSASASASAPPLVFPEERDPKAAKGSQESLDGDRRIDRCIFVVFVFFVAGWLAG